MNLRFIYVGAIVLILAIAVYGISYFSARQFFPLHTKPEPQSLDTITVSSSLEPLLIPPFDEKEIKPASEIWQRWENLKRETDMAVE